MFIQSDGVLCLWVCGCVGGVVEMPGQCVYGVRSVGVVSVDMG